MVFALCRLAAGRSSFLHQSERRAFAAGACGQAEAALASADTGRGGFCAELPVLFAERRPQAAVYLGEDLREAYRQEAKRFYDPGLFGELLKVFAQMEGVYSSVSEFLEKAAGAIGLQDIRKPWLIFQALFGQKLLEVRKSDKIIHIHLKEEGAFCPEQSGYFRAIRDLADGKV